MKTKKICKCYNVKYKSKGKGIAQDSIKLDDGNFENNINIKNSIITKCTKCGGPVLLTDGHYYELGSEVIRHKCTEC